MPRGGTRWPAGTFVAWRMFELYFNCSGGQKMVRKVFRVVAASVAVFVGSSVFAQTVIQPTAAQSKDTFVYSFLPTFNFNASPGFDALLASGRSSSGHDLRSLVQFDLTGVTLGAGEIATFNLYVADGGTVGFPVINPSPAAPVIADVFPVTAAWDVATVTWGTQPTFGATVLDSETIDGIGRHVTFDVTSQVQAWLANPATNFGFSVQQRDVVLNGGSVQAVYHSSGGANRPFLYVGAVPEPAGVAALASLATMFILRRRT